MITFNSTTSIQKLKEMLQEFDSCMYIERDYFLINITPWLKAKKTLSKCVSRLKPLN